ncbi:MAG: 16S rRNA (guanine(527)-N(7))-methyltransferase RsmG [Planctomycetota bacterium]
MADPSRSPRKQEPQRWRASLDLPPLQEPLKPPLSFGKRVRDLGIELEADEVEKLGGYLSLLLATNKIINLTAIRDEEDAWTKHIADALTLLPLLAEVEAESPRLVDVGTGGGLPGMVLAIVRPDVRVTLLDSTEKKCRFLDHAAAELGLSNVVIRHDRAESAAQERGERVDRGGTSERVGALRGSFDVVTARAVGRLATLAELTVPFAKVGGLCLLIKGEKAEEELAEAKAGLHLLHAAHAGTVPTPTGRVVVLEKLRETPKSYPRADGLPKREPLGV